MGANEALQHTYKSPSNIQPRDLLQTAQIKQVNRYSSNLRERMCTRPKFNRLYISPPDTGRLRRTYVEATTGPPTIPPQTTIQQENLQVPETLQTSVRDTILSTLTGTQQTRELIASITATQNQQMQEMVSKFQQSMNDMMHRMMTLVTNLITSLMGNGRIEAIKPFGHDPGIIQRLPNSVAPTLGSYPSTVASTSPFQGWPPPCGGDTSRKIREQTRHQSQKQKISPIAQRDIPN